MAKSREIKTDLIPDVNLMGYVGPEGYTESELDLIENRITQSIESVKLICGDGEMLMKSLIAFLSKEVISEKRYILELEKQLKDERDNN